MLVLKACRKNLLKGDPPQSWPWKQNGTTVVAIVIILEGVNNWRSMLQINIFLKKLDFEPEPPSVTGKLCYQHNSWVNSVCMAYMFDRGILEEKLIILSDYLNQI